jgi:FkbM family methyltransferase
MKQWLINNFPWLGKWKRFLKAWKDSISPLKKSYAQHGEDALIIELLGNQLPAAGEAVFIDVGANHPTDISNTYLFYRKGYTGITVEPNTELAKLHRRFRKKDTTLEIGCFNEAALKKFNISRTPVVSSFSGDVNHFWKTVFVPVFPLDTALRELPQQPVFFLNIDVEGFDFQVLQGATETLKRTRLVCVECNTPEEEKKVTVFMQAQDFTLVKQSVCNFFFTNNRIGA